MSGELNMEIKRVQRIEFSILTQEQIRNGSVCQITKSNSLKENGKPEDNGLFDERMGPFDKGEECKTCRAKRGECSGHFGHIELGFPVYNPIYMKYILKILKLVCPNCKRLYCHDDEYVIENSKDFKKGEERLKLLKEYINKNYEKCGKKKDKDSKKRSKNNQIETNEQENEGEFVCTHHIEEFDMSKRSDQKFVIHKRTISEETKKVIQNQQTIYPPHKVRELFEGLHEDDIIMLGMDPNLSHPKDMIMKYIPVPPPCVRPTVRTEKGKTGKDDLTIILENILTCDQRVRSEDDRNQGIKRNDIAFNELQNIVAQLYMKGIKIEGKVKKKKLKSIEERLSGKEGRLRLNLMGKRVDFSARTVISPDPNLSMDEVGVPIGIAKKLTFPERVTEYNREELQKLVNAGQSNYPGAFLLEKKSGQYYRCDGHEKIVQIGDIVHRYLKNGDYVIFNRQPSLHRMSMMGHKVRILPFSTFRMNLCDTTPYNADFDGDEMNLHVPQTLEARAEVATIMLTPTQIITPEKNAPVMGIVQDTQCGSYLITKRSTFIEKEIFYNILQWLDNFNGVVPIPTILKPAPRWTGKQVFSKILPDLNFQKGDYSIETLLKEGPCLKDDNVFIQNGIHMTGYLSNKTQFGKNSSGIVHSIWKDCGMEKTKEFFNKTQQTVNSWLLTRGFTIGIGDVVVPQRVHENIRKEIEKSKKEAEGFLEHKRDSEIELVAGNTMFENFENKLSSILANLNSNCEKIAKNALSKNNNLLAMVESGSKGSNSNILQMVAYVGKQEINGTRIPFGFDKRTLPHYTKEEYGFVARGFVEHSFVIGLQPQEFFFHAMGGRQGIIDTAIKTAETGYIQRRLVKTMEDVQCKYDKTVRRTTGDMVQFMYGGDGYDALMCETQNYKFIFDKPEDEKLTLEQYDEKKMKHMYLWDFEDKSLPNLIEENILNKFNTDEYREMFQQEYNELMERREQLYTQKRLAMQLKPQQVVVAVHFERQITNVISKDYLPMNKPTNLDPKYIIEKRNELFDRLSKIGLRKNENAETSFDYKIDEERNKDSLISFETLFRTYLSTKQCLLYHHLKKESFDDLLQRIERIYEKGIVNPGEMIGSIAAQSIGAPATQMTLNTFHHAGSSSTTVTQGVPRLKELLNMSKMPKTPSMKIFLKNDPNQKQVTLDKILNRHIPLIKFQHIIDKVEIWFDPDKEEHPFDDKTYDDAVELTDDDDWNRLSKYVLRIFILQSKLISIGIDPDEMEDYLNSKTQEFLEPHPRFSKSKIYVVQYIHGNDACYIIYVKLESNVVRTYSSEEELKANDNDDQDPNHPIQIHKQFVDDLMEFKLSGIQGVEKVILKKKPEKVVVVDPQTKYRKEIEQWTAQTEGSNLRDVSKIEDVDFTRTTSNNVYEVYQFLGVEAGRLQLINEFIETLSAGNYVNNRHLALLADVMTFTGRMEPVSRIGLSRGRAGVITRASFEQTLEQFRRAATFSENDVLNGVSQNILMGQRTVVGTGAFTVLIDMDELLSDPNNQSDESYEDNEGDKNVLDNFNFKSPIRVDNILLSPKRRITDDKIHSSSLSSPSLISPKPGQPSPRPSPFINMNGKTPFFGEMGRPSPSFNGASPGLNPSPLGSGQRYVPTAASPLFARTATMNASPFIRNDAQPSPLQNYGKSSAYTSSPFLAYNYASPQVQPGNFHPTPVFTQKTDDKKDDMSEKSTSEDDEFNKNDD